MHLPIFSSFSMAVAWAAGAAFAGAMPAQAIYSARGVGGGGAMAAYSISPYAELRFVGTDMGTLFRSTDGGKHWQGIDQREAGFSGDLGNAPSLGFSSDGHTVFHAAGGLDPKRSSDQGLRWRSISMPLRKEERIRYWVSDRLDPGYLLCATSAGLLYTHDDGLSWRRFEEVGGKGVGTFLYHPDPRTRIIYHATREKLWVRTETAPGHGAHAAAASFREAYAPPARAGHLGPVADVMIRAFAGGADKNGVTLALIDSQGKEACAWAQGDANTIADCGFVWTSTVAGSARPEFSNTGKEGGDFVRMAENDSSTIYVTGGWGWFRQYGGKIWVSADGGRHWELRFNIYDWDQHPYRPWPKEKLEYSAVGLDVGWDDGGYYGFAVNPRDSSDAGGTGNYFLHTTRDQGKTWQAPFTEFADTGERTRGKAWRSTGLEVTSVLRLKFNPSAPKVAYASVSDLGGWVTEDGGDTWRIAKAQYNTNYDYAFDPSHPDWVYAASGALHDFPVRNQSVFRGSGGIYVSTDRGRGWKRLTPDSGPWNCQFLSVAYDPVHHILYGGTQGFGIARSRDGGASWEPANEGLPPGFPPIVPQLEIDPVSGDAYALLSGDLPDYKNHDLTGIYFLDASTGRAKWRRLRGRIEFPKEVDPRYDLWNFPTAFAVDFSQPARNVLWLADFESHAAWLASGIWKSTDRGKTWRRSTQFTHPTGLTLASATAPGSAAPPASRVFASGSYTPGWGKGGALYSDDGGKSWRKNEQLPFVTDLEGTVVDPADPDRVFYLFFGNGMLYGPRPR